MKTIYHMDLTLRSRDMFFQVLNKRKMNTGTWTHCAESISVIGKFVACLCWNYPEDGHPLHKVVKLKIMAFTKNRNHADKWNKDLYGHDGCFELSKEQCKELSKLIKENSHPSNKTNDVIQDYLKKTIPEFRYSARITNKEKFK